MKLERLIIIAILLAIVSNIYATNKPKVYYATIKYMNGQKVKGRLILTTDSSLILVTSLNDTVNISAVSIRIITLKRKFKHVKTSLLTFSGLALITGIYIYSDYKPQGIDLGRIGSAVVGGLYIGHAIALPVSVITIGLKEFSKKKYYINGLQLKYGYLRPYLKKYTIN